tara:strand:+ start:339 stop:455 length:117 start_codon:yes stop_codon:yes gene_type:complete
VAGNREVRLKKSYCVADKSFEKKEVAKNEKKNLHGEKK